MHKVVYIQSICGARLFSVRLANGKGTLTNDGAALEDGRISDEFAANAAGVLSMERLGENWQAAQKAVTDLVGNVGREELESVLWGLQKKLAGKAATPEEIAAAVQECREDFNRKHGGAEGTLDSDTTLVETGKNELKTIGEVESSFAKATEDRSGMEGNGGQGTGNGGGNITRSEVGKAREAGVSETTKQEFASDPATAKWNVETEPEVVRRLEPQKLKSVKPVALEKGNNIVRRAIKKLFAAFGKVKNQADSREVVFNGKDAGKMMMQSGVDMRTFAPQLKELFETALPAWSDPPMSMEGHKDHGDVLGYRHYVNKFVGEDGKEYYIRFTVREHRGTPGRKGVHAATVSEVAIYDDANAAKTVLGNNPGESAASSLVEAGSSVRANELRGRSRAFTDDRLAKFLGKGKGVKLEFGAAPVGNPETEPLYAAAEAAKGNKAVELKPIAGSDGTFTTLAFPDAKIKIDGEQKVIAVDGLTVDDFAGMKVTDAAALVASVEAKAAELGLDIGFYDDGVRAVWEGVKAKIEAEGAAAHERQQLKGVTNAVVEQLKKSGLAGEVVGSIEEFNAKTGRRLTSEDGNVYGIVDPETGHIYLNPEIFGTKVGLETPIHEFGHLGVIECERVNKPVYDRGMKLAMELLEGKGLTQSSQSPQSGDGETSRTSRTSRETNGGIQELVDFVNETYADHSAKGKAEELMAQLIGKRGAAALKSETNATVVQKVKAWLVEFWNTFGKALGLKDITPEQAEKMTLEDVADAIRAEMFSGRKYGEGLDRVEFGDGGAKIVTKPTRIKRKLTGRRKAVNEFVRLMGGAEDPANPETDLLALWVDNGGRLFGKIPFEIQTNYSSGKSGVKTTRRAVADEFAESSAFYRGLDARQRNVFFGSGELEYGAIGEGLKGDLEAAGITRFTREDGTVDYEAVIDEFKRQWSNYERGEEVLKERNAWQEERDRAYVEEMERAEQAEYEAVFGKDEGAALSPEEAAAQDAQIAADIAAGRFSRGGVRFSRAEIQRRTEDAKAKGLVMDETLDKLSQIQKDFTSEKEKSGIGIGEYYKRVNATFGANYIFELGKPYGRLAKFIPDGDLQLKLKTLMRKMKEQYKGNHPFTFEETKNLVENVNNPPLIMRRDEATAGAKTFFEAPGGRIFCASINPKGKINDIETLYPKDVEKLIKTIARSKGKSKDILDVDTPKAIEMLTRWSNTTLGEHSNGLEDAISVLNNFGGVNGGIRFSRSGIFTGTAADYANRSRQGGVDDGPSLLKIGTGEGAQVYGWGLYGSTVRGVAEGYAKDAREYNAEKNGKRIDLIFPKNMLEAETAKRLMENGGDVRKTIEKLKRKGIGSAIIKELEEHGAEYSVGAKHEHLYEQTFFTDRAPGDESHLLKWYEPVSEEQFAVIGKAGLDVEEKRRTVDGETIRRVQISKDGELLLQVKDKSEITGQDLYGLVAKALGTPQAASEFLARAGIDGVKYPVDSYGGKGVKDGDEAGWNYVSFRDDNIRVDHKWTDGKLRFSRAPSQSGQEYTYSALTAKPDMSLVQVDAERAKQYGDHVSWKLADARKSILAAGGRLEKGHYIIDMEGEPVEVGKKGLLHGKHNRSNDFVYPILGEVLKNAVRVNELGVREGFREEGKKDDQVNSKFVYLGAAALGDVILPVRIQIDRKAGRNEIGEIDVLKSINAKVARAPAEADSTGHRPPSISPTQISIANLIGIAQPLHPQIFSRDVAAALKKPYQGDEIGALYSRAPAQVPEAKYVKLTRVADDVGQGEQTPGAIAASAELMRQGATPLTQKGTRYVSLPLSELHALSRYLTGHAMPAEMESGKKLGAAGKASLKNRKLTIAADVLGVVDKTDAAAETATLKQHGFFRHENANWCATHSPSEVRQERARSEDALSSRLEALADRRISGREPGGNAAGRKVFADQLAKVVMSMPHGQPGVLGAMQTVAGALEKRVRGSDAEADAFIDWMEGRGTGNGQQGTARSPQERKAEMFAAFLIMPKEMESRAKGWYDAIRSTIAADQKLAGTFRKMTARSMSEQGYMHLEAEILRMQNAQTEAAIKKLQAEANEPIKAGGKLDQAKETVVLACDDRMGAAAVRVDAAAKVYLAAQKKLMAAAKTPAEKAQIKQQTDLFMGQLAQAKNQAELSRTAWERGRDNADARYLWRMVDLLNEATVRDGLKTQDLSLYLDQMRVIETRGLSGSRGESARQAQLVLDAMRRRLGGDFAKVEAFARKFHAIHEQELLNNPLLEKILGKGTADYWRSQTSYVTTKRTFSPEELDDIDRKRFGSVVGRAEVSPRPDNKGIRAAIKNFVKGLMPRRDGTVIKYKESDTDTRWLADEATMAYNTYANKEYKLPTGGVLYFAPDARTVAAYGGDVEAAWGEYVLHLVTHRRGQGDAQYRSFDGSSVDKVLPNIEKIIAANQVKASDGRIVFYMQTVDGNSKSKSRYACLVTEPDADGNLRVDLRYVTGMQERGYLPGETATLEEAIRNRTAEGRALPPDYVGSIANHGGGGKIKSWLVEFWNTFGKALGLKEITPEQAEKMTVEDVADAIRAEMFSGRKYGELEYPQFLTLETGRMPDSIGQDALSEVK